MGERARQEALAGAEDDTEERRGLYTSGVVALRDGHRVALFFSGRRHAGENLAQVLKHRAEELPPQIQMCDALSRNLPGELQTIVANCLAHARRRFVDVYDRFPEVCRHLLETLAVVYRNDALARERQLSPEARLRLSGGERADDARTAGLVDAAIGREADRGQFGPRRRDQVHAQAVGCADAVLAPGGCPTGQQPVRAGLEEGD